MENMWRRRHYQNTGHIGWRRVLSPALTNAPPFLGIELFSHVQNFLLFQAICKAAVDETENYLYTVGTQQTLRGNLQFVPSPSQPNKFLETTFLYNYENLEIAGGIDSSSNNRDNRANIIRCMSSHMVTNVFLMPPNKSLLFRSLTQSRFQFSKFKQMTPLLHCNVSSTHSPHFLDSLWQTVYPRKVTS